MTRRRGTLGLAFNLAMLSALLVIARAALASTDDCVKGTQVVLFSGAMFCLSAQCDANQGDCQVYGDDLDTTGWHPSNPLGTLVKVYVYSAATGQLVLIGVQPQGTLVRECACIKTTTVEGEEFFVSATGSACCHSVLVKPYGGRTGPLFGVEGTCGGVCGPAGDCEPELQAGVAVVGECG